MLIKIQNFGPISNFEFDLEKDFHLIVGENNVGKSYAITAIYLVIKAVLKPTGNVRILDFSYLMSETSMKHVLRKVFSLREQAQIVFKKEVETSIKEMIESLLLPAIQDSFKGSFDSIDNLSNKFVKENFSIALVFDSCSFVIRSQNGQLSIDKFRLNHKIRLKAALQNRKPRRTDKQVTIYYNVKNKSKEHFTRRYSEFIFESYFEIYSSVARYVEDIHYLPASRSGLYQALSAFGQIVAELSKNRAYLTKKIELPGIPEPLGDYFLKITEIKARKKNYEQKVVNKIAEEIENDILHGNVEFDSRTKRLLFRPEGTGLRLDLASTSSMVSELSPIVSYLRYVLTESSLRPSRLAFAKHLIIIEEPEAHLHPEVQIKLTEIFSKLVKNNVKIIITSHSNYIFNKLNNLILEKKLDTACLSATVFKASGIGSLGLELDMDELGIEDDNFIDAAEALYNEKTELIGMLNQND